MVFLAFGAGIQEGFPSRFSLSGTFLCQFSFSSLSTFLLSPKEPLCSFFWHGQQICSFSYHLSPPPAFRRAILVISDAHWKTHHSFDWTPEQVRPLSYLNGELGFPLLFRLQGPPILYNNSVMDAWEICWNFFPAELPTSRNDPK